MSYQPVLLIAVAALMTAAQVSAEPPQPPEGFRALFNGTDLSGWHGHNPHQSVKLSGEAKQANLQTQRDAFTENWTVENGELVNDGHGPYAGSDEEFGDIELRLEYKTVPKADSGIYLRGTPQVQIWDWHQVFDPQRQRANPIWVPADCSTTPPAPRGVIRWCSPTNLSENGIRFGSAKSAGRHGSG